MAAPLFLAATMGILHFTLVTLFVSFATVPASLTTSGATKASNVVFQLFTRENPTEPQILELDNLDLLYQSNFDPSLPTKIYAHGWVGNPAAQGWGMRDGFLQHEDCNFIAVDWSILAQGDYSVVARDNVPIAGSTTGLFIDFLTRQGSPIETFHLIGFSMGAHVVGIAGNTVTSGKLRRITGVDPAARDFLSFELAFRLDISDADFVDIIHTSSTSMQEAIGHADFYPNGGNEQPGCPVPDTGCCNHCRAVYLFDESITSPVGFRSVQCQSWQEFLSGACDANPAIPMGNPVPTTSRGTYFLATNAEPPYAIP